MFEYKVRAKHNLGYKEFKFYADTDIEEFLNRNNIEYVRNASDIVENRLLKKIDRTIKFLETLEIYDYDGNAYSIYDINGNDLAIEGIKEIALDILKGVNKE